VINLPYAAGHHDLVVYRKAVELARRVFGITRRFPREEAYSLTDQVRRSSRSIGAQIAEAWAKRRYERQFVSKLTDADGEQAETQHWLEVALDCGYITAPEAQAMIAECREIGRMLGGMMAKSEAICKPEAIREPPPEYLV
jgi:four helix bundle protein